MTVDVVIPSVGRESLQPLLARLVDQRRSRLGRIVVVDDRPRATARLALPPGIRKVRGPARGPAAARNAGWRLCTAPWITFLDDDVLPTNTWAELLVADLERLQAHVAGSQGRIVVPLPAGRRPTDWERHVKRLETARYATADIAYRRDVLSSLGGFDERFRRAYREDADLALRVREAGYEIAPGVRTIVHPVRPAPASISVRLQAGNSDDALMRALHGPGWRERASTPPGRLPRHVVIAAAVAAAAGGAVFRRPAIARLASAVLLGGTLELAWARIAPGPRTPQEAATMLWTSAVIPPAAVAHRLRGELRARRTARRRALVVLLDRDGTLVHDVPYNGDPRLVTPMPGARDALDRLRAAGLRLGVITNQSAIGRGLVSRADVDAVNRRVEEMLGPFEAWLVCPHAPGEGCSCRKPAPGLVLEGARRLGVEPRDCVVVGDIGSDVEAALAAGARAVLVPTERTSPEEIAATPAAVAPDLSAAVSTVLRSTV